MKFYTLGQASEILGLRHEILSQWDYEGKIRTVRVGMNRLYDISSLIGTDFANYDENLQQLQYNEMQNSTSSIGDSFSIIAEAAFFNSGVSSGAAECVPEVIGEFTCVAAEGASSIIDGIFDVVAEGACSVIEGIFDAL